MKQKILWSVLLGGIMFSSCIQDEALNAECDIERCTVRTENASSVFFTESDTAKSVASLDSVITFSVRKKADLKSLAVYFELTDGATIIPANGSVQDFSNGGVRYQVTSQDGHWHRSYVVRFEPMAVLTSDTIRYSFEHYELESGNKKYYLWYSVGSQGERVNEWATGNPGYKLSRSSAKPMDYPSIPYNNGVKGSAVELVTCDTGPFGAMVNMRIAAGNLFIGTFDADYALKDAMQATCFGLPFNKKPMKFTGYYKYTPGQRFQDRKGNTVEGKTDSPDIYAVFYKNTDSEGKRIVLHGDDVLTHPNIVAMARLANPRTGTEWERFELNFDYTKEIDMDMLEDYGYSMAVVFTSSIEGASFCGALGSSLTVDEVQVVCASEE